MPLDADAPASDSVAADLAAAYDSLSSGADTDAGSAPDTSTGGEQRPAADAQGASGQAAGPTAPPAAPAAALEAPKHWPEDKRALFGKQPREVQEYLLERMSSVDAEFTKRNQEFAPLKQFREQIDGLLAPFRQTYQAQGIDDVGAIKSLFNSYAFLKSNPREALTQYAKAFGVDLSELAGGGQAQAGEPDPAAESPVVKQLRDQVAQLTQQLTGFTQTQQQSMRAKQLSEIQAFADEKGDDGQPLRPYFDSVANEIAGLFKAGMAANLADAYEKAILLNPEVRTKVQAEQAAAAQKKAATQQAAEVDKAKKAGFSVVGSGASADDAPADSIRGELSRLWDKFAA